MKCPMVCKLKKQSVRSIEKLREDVRGGWFANVHNIFDDPSASVNPAFATSVSVISPWPVTPAKTGRRSTCGVLIIFREGSGLDSANVRHT